jgi:hypothetical protein
VQGCIPPLARDLKLPEDEFTALVCIAHNIPAGVDILVKKKLWGLDKLKGRSLEQAVRNDTTHACERECL